MIEWFATWLLELIPFGRAKRKLAERRARDRDASGAQAPR